MSCATRCATRPMALTSRRTPPWPLIAALILLSGASCGLDIPARQARYSQEPVPCSWPGDGLPCRHRAPAHHVTMTWLDTYAVDQAGRLTARRQAGPKKFTTALGCAKVGPPYGRVPASLW